jgi:uncharacterized protein (TIGR02453 family)
MLRKSTIDFLKSLKKNNNRDWFEANRGDYEAAKADFTTLVEHVLGELGKLDARFLELSAKDCMFRINRDVRFSKDKSPYKTNFGAGFTIGGKKSALGGFYVHVEPDHGFIGGGLWMPQPDQLKKIRQEIDYSFHEFNKIIEDKTFKKTFGTLDMENALKNPPKGYEAENPAIEFIKLKSFVTGSPIQNNEWVEKGILTKISTSFKQLNPFISFINTAISS